jgi:hypothetical protein
MPFVTKTNVRTVFTIGATVIVPFQQLTHVPIYSQPDPVPQLAKLAVASSVTYGHDMGCAVRELGMPMSQTLRRPTFCRPRTRQALWISRRGTAS